MILYICVACISIIIVNECCRTGRIAGIGTGYLPDSDMRGSRARQYQRLCLAAVFIILFAVSAARMNVGNDYAKYVEFMHRLYTDAYIDDPGVPTEWGFNILTRIIYALSGYENFLLVFAIYSFATVFIFLKAMWEQSEDFALTFFMFMALGYYFQSFSTVRYYLALAIAMYSMKFVMQKRWAAFVLVVLLGTGFHKSILVILPLYYLATYAWKKWQLAIVLIVCSSTFFLQDLYLNIVVRLYPSYADTEYLDGSGFSYINIMRCMAVLVLALLCFRSQIQNDKRKMFMFYLNLGALALYIFGAFLPIVSRIGYYLTVSHILFVPALIKGIDDKYKRNIVRIGVVLVCIMYFIMYLLKASDDGVLVLPYRTFFFNDMVDILSDVS